MTISVMCPLVKSNGGRRTTIRSIVTSVICWNVMWRQKSSSKRSWRAFSARLTKTAPGPSLHHCLRARRRRTEFLITTSCRRRSGLEFWRRNYAQKSKLQIQRTNSSSQPEHLTMSTAVKKEHKSARPERGGQATLVEAIRQGIWEEMERDKDVFVIGEDVGAYGGAFKVTDGLIDEFGKERVIDTPISEGAIVGAACGAALM